MEHHPLLMPASPGVHYNDRDDKYEVEKNNDDFFVVKHETHISGLILPF